MSTLPKRAFLTAAEYLAIERKAEFKSEYFNGEMFAMAGAARPHNRLKCHLCVKPAVVKSWLQHLSRRYAGQNQKNRQVYLNVPNTPAENKN